MIVDWLIVKLLFFPVDLLGRFDHYILNHRVTPLCWMVEALADRMEILAEKAGIDWIED